MTNEEVQALVDKYYIGDKYQSPTDIELRVDHESEAVIYSMVRYFKPKVCLQIGCWEGGTTNNIISALKANGEPYFFQASELLEDKIAKTLETTSKWAGATPMMIGDITKNLDKVPKKIDFLYHDTDHDRLTTEWIVKHIFPRIKKGSLIIFHDWAVEEIDGKWVGKGGMWPETEYLLELHEAGKLPLKKVYWNYHNPENHELGVFTYEM